VHLKIETGLNRQGIGEAEALKLAKSVMRHKEQIFLEGIYTHFSNIEDTLDPSFYKNQLGRFKKTLALLKRAKIFPPFVHCAASAGILLYPESLFNMVRVGIGLYGLWPSREIRAHLNKRRKSMKLRPALSWKSIVAQVKGVKSGSSVGYGRTWTFSRNSKIAVIPVGYWDGYDRKFSNNSRVLVRGRFAPVIGRVAMNMIIADVTDIPMVAPEDEVVLLGKMGHQELSAEEMATRISTINYEIVTRINPTIPRVIVR
jgi:alanine racemase